MRPLVQVAMPTRGYAYAPSLLDAVELSRACGVPLSLEIGRPIEWVRTKIARAFLATSATHLLMIDDDIVAPEGALDRLLALDAAVATAPCPIFVDGGIVSNVKGLDNEQWVEVPPDAAFRVAQTGLGFTLIRRDVFEHIRTPWFQFGSAEEGRMIGEDVWFSNGVTQAGLEIICDGRVKCHHYKDGLDLLRVAGW
jgi:hypothetical protein